MKRIFFMLALVTLVGGANVPASARNGNLGIQGGFSGDLDWYIGLRSELESARLFKDANAVVDFNWFFPDGDKFNYFDFNFNYLWPLSAFIEDNKSNVYVGTGLNVGRGWVSDVDDSSNWEFGMNAIAGFKFQMGLRSAFVEGAYTFITDFDQWRIGTGFLF